MWSIWTGPAFSPVAVIWTSWKSRLATWVRNGKPSMVTCGLLLKPWACISAAPAAGARTLLDRQPGGGVIAHRAAARPGTGAAEATCPIVFMGQMLRQFPQWAGRSRKVRDIHGL